MLIFGLGLEGKLNFHPFNVEFLVYQKNQLLPTFRFLVNLFELLHVSGKEVQQFEMKLDLLQDFLALAEASINLAAHHQADIVFWNSRMILLDFQDDSLVAGPSFHPQHVGFIRREGSYIPCYFFRRFPLSWLLEFLVLLNRTDCFVAPSPDIFD